MRQEDLLVGFRAEDRGEVVRHARVNDTTSACVRAVWWYVQLCKV
jgi:hypothetical protein